MPVTWNAESDAKLLVAIIATSKQSIDYDTVAKHMGEGVTVPALRHRITRLKLKAQVANSPQRPSGAANASAQSTPSKRKRTKASQGPKTEEVETKVKKEEDGTMKMENEAIKKEETDDDTKGDEDYYPSDC